MRTQQAIITPKGVERVQAGHLWIYRSDVSSSEAEPGSVVTVADKSGNSRKK